MSILETAKQVVALNEQFESAMSLKPDSYSTQLLGDQMAQSSVNHAPALAAALVEAEAAIQELATLKDMKDEGSPELMAEYAERKPLAWAAARAFLSRISKEQDNG